MESQKLHTINSQDFQDDFEKLVNDQETSDVIVLIGKEEYPVYVHKIILAARSPVFNAMFYGTLKKKEANSVKIIDYDKETVLLMLKYIYTGKITTTLNTCYSLLQIANEYDIPNLQKECSSILLNSISESNCFGFLELANLYNQTELSRKCLEFICYKAETLLSSQDFLELPQPTLIQILSQDLQASELCIFSSLLEWIKANPEVTDYTQVFYLIRFPLLSPQELFTYVKNEPLVPHELYLESMEYHAYPDGFNKSLPQFTPRQCPVRLLTWNPYPNILLTNNNRTLTKNGISCWDNRIICPVKQDRGIFSCYIRIDAINADRSGIVIGVCSYQDESTAFNSNEGLGMSGNVYKLINKGWQGATKDEKLVLIINFSTRMVEYRKNDQLQALSTHVPSDPCIYAKVYYNGDSLTISN
jgi:hypothetical protein